jgi:hypothetical protein
MKRNLLFKKGVYDFDLFISYLGYQTIHSKYQNLQKKVTIMRINVITKLPEA